MCRVQGGSAEGRVTNTGQGGRLPNLKCSSSYGAPYSTACTHSAQPTRMCAHRPPVLPVLHVTPRHSGVCRTKGIHRHLIRSFKRTRCMHQATSAWYCLKTASRMAWRNRRRQAAPVQREHSRTAKDLLLTPTTARANLLSIPPRLPATNANVQCQRTTIPHDGHRGTGQASHWLICTRATAVPLPLQLLIHAPIATALTPRLDPHSGAPAAPSAQTCPRP